MHKFSIKLAAKKSKYDEEGLDGYDWYEGQTKWPLTRIIKVVFCTISVLVWAVILFRIYSSSNGEFEKMILLNDRAAPIYYETHTPVVRINSSTENQEDNAALTYYPIYLPETENLQFTVRINRNHLPPGKGETGYTFILRAVSGEETTYYPLSYYEKEKTFQYTFFRLCFEGVKWDDKGVYTFLLFQGDYEALQGDQPYPVTDSKYHFVIKNSETYCRETTPKQDVFRLLKTK